MKRILISSNIIFFRNSLASLSEKYYETQMAADGKETLNSLFEFKPHIIFMDCTYPDMNSIELLRKIKKHNPYIIIYFFVGSLNKEESQKAKKMGVQEVCRKPLQNVFINQILKKIPVVFEEEMNNSEKHYQENYSDDISEITFDLTDTSPELEEKQQPAETIEKNKPKLNLSEEEKKVSFDLFEIEDLDIVVKNKELVIPNDIIIEKDINIIDPIVEIEKEEQQKPFATKDLKKPTHREIIIEDNSYINEKDLSDIMKVEHNKEVVEANQFLKEEFEKMLSVHNEEISKKTKSTMKETEDNLSKSIEENIINVNMYEKNIISKLDSLMSKFSKEQLAPTKLVSEIEESLQTVFSNYNEFFLEILTNLLTENKSIKEDISMIKESQLELKELLLNSSNKQLNPINTQPKLVEVEEPLDKIEQKKIITKDKSEYNHISEKQSSNQDISFEFNVPEEILEQESLVNEKEVEEVVKEKEVPNNFFISPPRPSDYDILKENKDIANDYEENDVTLIHFEDENETEEVVPPSGFGMIRTLFNKKR